MPLTVRKFAYRLNMGIFCHHDSDFIFFRSPSFLQITRIVIKSRSSSILG